MLLMQMREMPVKAAARILDEQDTRLWRAAPARGCRPRREDFAQVSQVGMDETSHRRGHDYVSVFVDLDRAKVLFATPTRERKQVGEFRADLKPYGGDPAPGGQLQC